MASSAYQATRNMTYLSSICMSVNSINSKGFFNGHNPLKYSVPLLLLQLFIASFTAVMTSVLLKPLGIPAMVSQIFAGVLLGPSFIGRFDKFLRRIFPFRSFLMIDTYATFGTIFQIFLIGVQLNPMMIITAGRKAILIGFSVVFLPLLLSLTCAVLIAALIDVDSNIAGSLMIVGVAQSMSAFPVIASYLSELNILNSEFSRVAFSSSLISGVLCFTLVTTIMVFQVANNEFLTLIYMIVAALMVIIIVVCVMRPVIKWMIKQIPEGQTMEEGYLCVVFLTVILLAWFGKFFNVHCLFGPFAFGMIIPSGPPLGTILVERLEYFNTWMIMPLFYTEHGMMINLFDVEFKHALLTEIVLLASCVGKFLGAFLPALYYNMSYKDATLLGLTMNAQGFIELSLFKMLKDMQLIDRASFEVMSGSMILITGALTPLVRYLYKSSMKYKLHNRRTIQHWEQNTELRVLACIYDQEHVPSIIHLLKATNPTKDSPINVSIIHFVELVGRATPLVISHKAHRKPSAATALSQRIINVFRRYEDNNTGSISVNPYTVVSPYPSMHNDMCMLALHKRSSLIILPYHKYLATGMINAGIRTVNCNVLDKAPCSVGILIDRGLLGGIKYVFANWESYRVAVVFIGGADDREALAYGTRMSGHPTIQLTVIRFMAIDDDEADNDMTQRSLDEEMVIEFKCRTAYNDRVKYVEEGVKNGIGIINVIESMEDKYELIILGRRHNENSTLILELTEWTKSELGTMGDVFMTSGYGAKATILIMQQQAEVAGCARGFQQEEPEEELDEDMSQQHIPQGYNLKKEEEVPFGKDDS